MPDSEKDQFYRQKAFSLYKEFNVLAFSNELPDEPPVHVRGKRQPATRSRFHFRHLRRRSKSLAYYDHRTKHITLYTDFAHRKEFPEVLLHEMVHMHMHMTKNEIGHTIAFWRSLKEKSRLVGVIPSQRLWWSKKAKTVLASAA